uniref:Reverse transcriptase/retrotransposon-derived protein RNase H-like domain-containing protein n=1 Tax=Cajanus cajan TaxID=3821 RepID=A0A151T161_CAJCA|nr:hypothetical protein KK1_023199 [Cajanus cajan]
MPLPPSISSLLSSLLHLHPTLFCSPLTFSHLSFELQTTLLKHSHIFDQPHGLPLMHSYDHHITFFPNSTPICVKPYHYLHAFNFHYVALAAPLMNLLCTGQSYQWTHIEQLAFTKSQEALTIVIVLLLPDFQLFFDIETDAFTSVVAIVLLQQGHHIAYFIKKMCPKLQAFLHILRK